MKSGHGTELFLITENKILNGTFLHIWFLELAAWAELWYTNKNPYSILKLSDMSQVRLGQVKGGKELKWDELCSRLDPIRQERAGHWVRGNA